MLEKITLQIMGNKRNKWEKTYHFMKMVKRQQHRFPESREFNSAPLKVAESTVLKRHEDF